MSDETITQAEREMLIGRHKGGSKAADDIRWLLAALTAAEKRATDAEVMLAMMQRRAEEAEREAERLRHGAPVEGDFVCPNALRLAEETEARLVCEEFVRESDARAEEAEERAAGAEHRAKVAAEENSWLEAKYHHDVRHYLDARQGEATTAAVHRVVDGLRVDLARLQPLIDAARAYAAVPGDRFASPEEDDLRGAALALFPEEVRRG